MKKLVAFVLLLSTVLSLASCNLLLGDKFDIAETKKINLGKEVDSVTLTVGDGEEITFDYTAEFYEIFDKLSADFDKEGKKYSYIAEHRLKDETKSHLNMNVYGLEDAWLYVIRAKEEGEDAFASIDEYYYSKRFEEEKRIDTTNLGRYLYMNEKALGGIVRNKDGQKIYSSDLYPLMPITTSDLGELHIRSSRIRNITQYTKFFDKFESEEISGGVIDFSELVKREYKLYKNYIVFKQTAPCLMKAYWPFDDSFIFHSMISNSDCSVTQEAYYNVKTGEFDLVKVYGKGIDVTGEYYGMEYEIDMSIYIHTNAEREGQKKYEDLFDYIKVNSYKPEEN